MTSIKPLRMGDRGSDVSRWQLFLIGQGFDPGAADGIFGKRTHDATIAFQKAHDLRADGVVGLRTMGQAMLLGIDVMEDPEDTGEEADPNFPPPPAFPPLVGVEARQRVFGAYRYTPAPVAVNPEQIRILGDWAERNIIPVTIPELKGIAGAPQSGVVQFHRLAARQLQDLWAAWGARGLIDRVLRWEGSFVPRFIRGSRVTLSNHAFGSAFDINARENALGVQPALVGMRGSVRELVEIANEHGFYWGGHFSMRRDGNHFEVARILGDDKDRSLPERPLPAGQGLLKLPPTPANPVTATAFLDQVRNMSRAEREQAIERAILDGNVPSFLRDFHEVMLAPRSDGTSVMPALIYVAPDYLAIGTDEDFLRIPMSPLTAQRIADAAGCILPTRRLVDIVYQRASLKLAPQPLTPGAQQLSNEYYARHNKLVEEQRAGRPIDGIVAGHKKDVVLSNRLVSRPDRVAIYGWHRLDGRPIQPLSTIHENTYADYSHGVRLVGGVMVVDGMEIRVADVLRDASYSALLSDEGPIPISRVPRV